MDSDIQCRDARQRADSFVAGELSVEASHAVMRHLESCPACRADVDARRALREQLRGAFLADPTLAPRAEWAAELAARLQSSSVPRRPAAVVGWWSGGLALAATLLLGASVAIYFGAGWRGATALAELARMAAGDHRNCAIKFALAERPIPLADAAARYDAAYRAFGSTPPDSFTARGGTVEVVDRHSCVYNGRRFAHVVMRYQGQVVSLLVTTEPAGWLSRLPGASEGNLDAPLPSVGDDVVRMGRAGGHAVFFVGDARSQAVRDVADAISPAVYSTLSGA